MTAHLSPSACKLEIPVDQDFLPVVRAFVESVGCCYGLPTQYRENFPDTTVAVTQLILDRAFGPGDLASIEIAILPIAGGLEIVIHDRGLPFDPELWTKDSSSHVLGRLHRDMDQVRFINLGPQGHETRLKKYFQRLMLESDAGGNAAPPDSQSPLQIRPLRKGEALQVSRCVYRCYGYSYGALEAAYYPDRLEALNAQGSILSVVAVAAADPDATGEVVGHMALERESSSSPLATVGVAAVLPEFRSRGLAQLLTEALLEQAQLCKIEEMQAFAVTSHPYSQKLAQSFHFRPLAIYLATAYFNFKGIREEGGQRETLVGLYRRLAGAPSREAIYPPMRHRAIIESLCKSIERPVDFPDAIPSAPLSGESVIVVRESPIRNLAKINIESYGSNWLERLRSHVRYLRQQDYRQFILTLPLRDPRTAAFATDIEKLGFFFAGLSVRENGLCLAMQFLHGVTLDYDKICTVEPMTKELLSYVKVMDPTKI